VIENQHLKLILEVKERPIRLLVTRQLSQLDDKKIIIKKIIKRPRIQDENVASGLADNVDGGRATFYAFL
jgi:hypothetical protein